MKLLSDEQLKRNADDDHDAYCDKNDNEDASSASHSVTRECTLNDEIDPDIEGDNDEAAAPLICDVEILLNSLAASNIMKSSNRAIRRDVRCAAYTLPGVRS